MIRLETAFVGADDGDGFAEDDLIIGVVEDAGEVDFFEGAGTIISDLTSDFNELLATEAFGGFHIDGTEGKFADVGLGFFGAGGSAR